MLEFVAQPSGDNGLDLSEGVNYFDINTYFYTEAAMVSNLKVILFYPGLKLIKIPTRST